MLVVRQRNGGRGEGQLKEVMLLRSCSSLLTLLLLLNVLFMAHSVQGGSSISSSSSPRPRHLLMNSNTFKMTGRRTTESSSMMFDSSSSFPTSIEKARRVMEQSIFLVHQKVEEEEGDITKASQQHQPIEKTHNTIEDETGVVDKEQEEQRRLQDFTLAMGTCQRDAMVLTSSSSFSCECITRNNPIAAASTSGSNPVVVLLSCIDSCGEYCNTEGTTCGIQAKIQVYDTMTGIPTVTSNGILYTKTPNNGGDDDDENSSLSIVQSNCTTTTTTDGDEDEEMILCQNCEMIINGEVSCNSCQVQTCAMPNDDTQQQQQSGISVDCENIQLNAIYDLGCPNQGPIVVEEGTVFEYLSTTEFQQCQRDSFEYCTSAATFLQDQSSSSSEQQRQLSCTCPTNMEYGGHTVTCTTDSCWYCNMDQTICATKVSSIVLDNFGQQVEYIDQYQYITEPERNEVIDYVQLSNPDENGNTCRVDVNGISCTSCQVLTTCPVVDNAQEEQAGEGGGIQVNCENLSMNGERFNTCRMLEYPRNDGIFQVFLPNQFIQCITPPDDDSSTTLSPTSASPQSPDGSDDDPSSSSSAASVRIIPHHHNHNRMDFCFTTLFWSWLTIPLLCGW